MLDISTVPTQAPTEFYCGSFDLTPRRAPVIPAPSHADIQRLKAAIVATGDLLDVEAMTHHHFAHGIYGREARIPAGAVVVGEMHRHSTLNILAQGEIAVSSGGEMKVLKAPAVFVSPPMTEKVGLALTDVVFINAHPSSETDLEKLRAEFIVPDVPALEGLA